MYKKVFDYRLFYDDASPQYFNNLTTETVAHHHNWNGNINGSLTRYHALGVTAFDKPTLYGYSYDGINRLTAADATVGDMIVSGSPEDVNNSYRIGDESYVYDRVGNIVSLLRVLRNTSNNPSAPYSVVDKKTYERAMSSNRLMSVYTTAPGGMVTSSTQFTYDPNGNLLKDSKKGISSTTIGRAAYTFNMTKNTDAISYLYSANDQRMYKKVVTNANTTEEYYLMDAFGKTLAIENMKALTDKWAYYLVTNERDAQLKPSDNSVQFNYGEATFFLYDHLGNTRVSYSKLSHEYVVHSLTDYYPYGKILREYVSTRPRYLTTQHERDTETDLDYRGARYYDSEYGRFLSVDPLAAKYPSLSSYVYVADNPIIFVDPDGKRIKFADNLTPEEIKVYKAELKCLRKRSATFRAMYKDLKKSKDTYTFDKTTELDGDNYNQKNKTIYINFNGNSHNYDLTTTIVHETGHAWRDLNGLDIRESDSPYGEGSVENIVFQKKRMLSVEFEGTHIENVVRSELGLNLREEYGERPDYDSDNRFRGRLDLDKGRDVMVGKDSKYDYTDEKTNHYEKLKERKHTATEINVRQYEDINKYH